MVKMSHGIEALRKGAIAGVQKSRTGEDVVSERQVVGATFVASALPFQCGLGSDENA